MNLKAMDDVLEHLFEGYVDNGGTPIFDVTEIIQSHGEDPEIIGRDLVTHGLVRDQRFMPGGKFMASISMAGIQRIRPAYIEENTRKIIGTLGQNGNAWTDVLAMLSFERKDFQRAFHIAVLLRDNEIVEMQAQAYEIFVKLTPHGLSRYRSNETYFS